MHFTLNVFCLAPLNHVSGFCEQKLDVNKEDESSNQIHIFEIKESIKLQSTQLDSFHGNRQNPIKIRDEIKAFSNLRAFIWGPIILVRQVSLILLFEINHQSVNFYNYHNYDQIQSRFAHFDKKRKSLLLPETHEYKENKNEEGHGDSQPDVRQQTHFVDPGNHLLKQ